MAEGTWHGPSDFLRAEAGAAVRAETPDELVAELQRLVHDWVDQPTGNAAATAASGLILSRKTLATLRALVFYPAQPILIPELTQLISHETDAVVRLAHYFIREASSRSLDLEQYSVLLEQLEAQLSSKSPARRAAALKTLARVTKPHDISRTGDFCVDFFDTIGGVRFKSDLEKKVSAKESKQKAKERRKAGKHPTASQSVEDIEAEAEDEVGRPVVDDGAGGVVVTAAHEAQKIKSKLGKQIAAHSVLAALRKIQITAIHNDTSQIPLEGYFIDSGLASITPSTVRHTMALLHGRLRENPQSVGQYLLPRLPHKDPPAQRKLVLEDLGAKVFYARILSALAQDPNVAAFETGQAPRLGLANLSINKGLSANRAGAGAGATRRQQGFFKFIFGSVRDTVALVTRPQPYLQRDDPLGVEFVEALVGLLKNPSNRILIEVLRGLARRKWSTWTEAPVPQQALFGSPDLDEISSKYGNESESKDGNDMDIEDDNFFRIDAEGSKDVNEEVEPRDDEEEEIQETSRTFGSGLDLQEDVEITAPEQGWNSTFDKTAFQRRREKRKKELDAQLETNTPFYMRSVGAGSVTALELVSRRIYASILNEESVRRFAAVDALIALSRSKIYGHSQEEMERLRNVRRAYHEKAKKGNPGFETTNGLGERKVDPLEALTAPVREVMDEDPSMHVRARAALALLFLLAAGAGGGEMAQVGDFPGRHPGSLLHLFEAYLAHPMTASGTGYDLTCRFFDALLYEINSLDSSLLVPSVELAEHWAKVHGTIGPAGRLLEVWETVLKDGGPDVAQAVGASVIACLNVKPGMERVGRSAAIFLRRRILDLSVLSIDLGDALGSGGVPEPLPRDVGEEVEKYTSALWHASIMGPSAECRHLAVEALGGAAALAGDPFRIEVYERLCELVKARGLGLRIIAEKTLDCLDTLFYVRERFEEALEKMRHMQRSSTTRDNWTKGVWGLAAEASSAAQILLGAPPPPRWLALGPRAERDVADAEEKLGDYRRRNMKGGSTKSLSQREAPPVISAVSLPNAKAIRDRHGSSSDAVSSSGATNGGEVALGSRKLPAGSSAGIQAVRAIEESKTNASEKVSEVAGKAKAAGLSAAYAVGPSLALAKLKK